ncbi:alpha/beta hydrolase-fold protein [Bacillus sp. ISL-55]|uniref:alpha/beta hydrolase-fold protein n=1 Tax=Bacillus sp. ISL-55 TaxID=2819134 RepID=UPI001BEB7DBE|nr:alpha/beta hydrolase-fold protein [Bacillus sp. ISL-55]MBT2694789.1 beta galactosidase jelly roll domain-containing protein [Bacillus sp. ISL-55]
MKNKKFVSWLSIAILLCSLIPSSVVAFDGETGENGKLDLSGDWFFTLGDNVEEYSRMDYDHSNWKTLKPGTGFLSGADFPENSFAWYRTEFVVPKGFSKDVLTLALGKIDDGDEVYLNGKLLASTGFEDGQFNESFWSQSREYELPASMLKYGKENVLAVRVYNAGGGGGIYEGPLGIFNETALRGEKGLPNQLADKEETKQLLKFVKAQQRFLETKKLDSYIETFSDAFFHDGYDKERQHSLVERWTDEYDVIDQRDERTVVFKDGDTYILSTYRTISGKQTGQNKTLVDEKQERFFTKKDGDFYETGNQSRFYQDTYYSDSFQKEMSYRVYLPDGYLQSKEQYPVVYLLHQYGSSSQQYEVDQLNQKLDKWMEEGKIQKMIVVMPDTSGNSWYVNKPNEPWMDLITEDFVPQVDSMYRTIDDPNFRAISGVSMGGFGAYVIGLNHPELFRSIASHMGALSFEFEGQNPLKLIKSLNEKEEDPNAAITKLKQFSFYLDGGTEDALTSRANSTNDIHKYFRNYNIPHQYSTRAGGHDSEFYLASMDKSFVMHSSHFTKSLASGSLKVSPQAVSSDETEVAAQYTVSVGEDIEKYSGESAKVPMAISLQVDDPQGQVVYKETKEIPEAQAKGYTGEFSIPTEQLKESQNFTVKLSLSLLGKNIDISSRPLIMVSQVVMADGEAHFDLLGDWKFKLDDEPSSPVDGNSADTNGWSVVQPGLEWWKNGFGGYENIQSYNGGAWYVREFELPEQFPASGLTLLGGKIDDADEIYVNGQLVGSTGMENGEFKQSHWAELRKYKLADSILKPGETNKIAIRLFDNNGDGGLYSGPIGLYSEISLRKAKGLPYEKPDAAVEQQVKDLFVEQITALNEKDLEGFSKTISANYFNDGKKKKDLIKRIEDWFAKDEVVAEADKLQVYIDGEQLLLEGNLVVKGREADGSTEILKEESMSNHFAFENGVVLETGNQKRFFVDSYYSGSLGAEKTARVYLPEGYENSDKQYPVVYLLHQFQSDSSAFELDKVDLILDQAIAGKEIGEMIVVMPDSDGMSWWVNQENGSQWMDMVTKDLVPYIDQTYRTIADKNQRGISGVSMGGFGAYVIGMQNTDLFTSFASHMGALSSTVAGKNPIQLVKNADPEKLRELSFYFDSGDEDFYKFDIPAIDLHHYLKSVGVPHEFEIRSGNHNSEFYTGSIVKSFKHHSEHFRN